MKELIKISEYNGMQAVSARDLHKFLEATERFSSWFERQLQFGFIESVDYAGCKKFNTLANQELTDFALTIGCAKEISMLQRNEKGQLARRYFIACEEKLKQISTHAIPQSYSEALMLAARQAEQIELQNKTIMLQAPKVEYYDTVLQSQSLIPITSIAKELGMSATTLNRLLNEAGVQYRMGNQWLLCSKYQNKGYTGTKTTIYKDSLGREQTQVHTYWTEKGKEFILSLDFIKLQ